MTKQVHNNYTIVHNSTLFMIMIMIVIIIIIIVTIKGTHYKNGDNFYEY